MGGGVYQTLEPKGMYYALCLSLGTTRIIAVPLFLMISGALLLNRNESFKVVCRKRVFRILIVLIIFSLIQELLSGQVNGEIGYLKVFLLKIVTGSIRGEYWYLYCYLAYLLLIPLLKGIADCMNGKLLIYIVFLSALTDLIALAPGWIGTYITFYNYIYIINGYAFLFPLCGYGAYKYLQNHRLNLIQNSILLIVFLGTDIFLTYLVHNEYMKTGIWEEGYVWRLTALLAVPVFMVVYDLIRRIRILNFFKYLIACVSNSCFGIYLCENILEHYTVKVYHWVYGMTGGTLFACFVYLSVTIMTGTVVFSLIKKCVPLTSKIL